MGRFTVLLCVVVLCVMYAHMAYSMHEQFRGDSISAPIIIFLPIFSVYKGAEINLTYNSSWDLPPRGSNQLLMALCTKDEASVIDFDSRLGCNYSDLNYTAGVLYNGTGVVDFHYIIQHYDSYYLFIINCQDQQTRMSYSLEGNLSIVNEEGELFSGDAPLLPLFKMFCSIWGIMFVFWILLRLTHDCTAHNARRIRYTHDLGKRLPHWTVSLIPLVQFVYCLIAYFLWNDINVVGTMPTLTEWDGPYSLSIVQRLTRSLMEAMTYGSVFVLSTGTRISRRRMTLKVFLIGLAGAVFLAVCSFFDENTLPTSSVTGIFVWVLHFTARLIMLTIMYVTASQQIQEQVELGAFEAPGSMYPAPDHPLYAAFERSRYFRSIRQICTLWIILDMALQFFMKMFVEDWTWVSEFFSQFEYLLLFIMLILTLRERPPPLPAQVRGNRRAGGSSARGPGAMHNEKVKARLQEFVKQQKQETPQ